MESNARYYRRGPSKSGWRPSARLPKPPEPGTPNWPTTSPNAPTPAPPTPHQRQRPRRSAPDLETKRKSASQAPPSRLAADWSRPWSDQGLVLCARLTATASRISALNAAASTSSPSAMSIARRVPPPSPELNRPAGSSSAAPRAKVSLTLSLDLAGADDPGVRPHRHADRVRRLAPLHLLDDLGSASRISGATRASVSPRQSPQRSESWRRSPRDGHDADSSPPLRHIGQEEHVEAAEHQQE